MAVSQSGTRDLNHRLRYHVKVEMRRELNTQSVLFLLEPEGQSQQWGKVVCSISGKVNLHVK